MAIIARTNKAGKSRYMVRITRPEIDAHGHRRQRQVALGTYATRADALLVEARALQQLENGRASVVVPLDEADDVTVSRELLGRAWSIIDDYADQGGGAVADRDRARSTANEVSAVLHLG